MSAMNVAIPNLMAARRSTLCCFDDGSFIKVRITTE